MAVPLTLILPDGVTLLDYYGAPVENTESLLHNEIQRNLRCGAGCICAGRCEFYRAVGLHRTRWQHTDQNFTGDH